MLFKDISNDQKQISLLKCHLTESSVSMLLILTYGEVDDEKDIFNLKMIKSQTRYFVDIWYIIIL